MTRSSVDRTIRFARDIDERILRRIESICQTVNAAGFEISVTFSNDFTVKCSTVQELLDVPASDAHKVKSVSISCNEDPVAARAAGRDLTMIRLRMADEFAFSRANYQIDAEYNTCVGLAQQFDTVFKITLAPIRSLLHIHPIIDFAVSPIVAPILIQAYALPLLDIHVATANFFMVQIPVVLFYVVLKTLIYPRIQFKWGYGAKAADRRIYWSSGFFGFLVLGALGAIYEDGIVNWWKGIQN